MRADAIFGRIAKAGRDNSVAIVDAIRARRARRSQLKPRHVFTELHRLADLAAPAIERVFKAAVAATKQATLEAKLEILLAHRLEHALIEAIPWKEHGSVILQVRMKALVRTLILKAGDAAQRFQPAGFRGTIRSDARGGDASDLRDLDQNKRDTLLRRTAREMSVRATRRGVILDDVGDITPREFAMAFDVSNPAAVQLAFARAGELITKIDQETQRAISRAVANAIESGRPPRVLARDLRNMIGLNERQQDAINAMRDDGESEIAIAKATREALNYRAYMVARTETTRASNLGQEALWQAADDAGLLDLSQWTREYVATGDPPRECMVCGDLDGQTFAVGEPIHTEMGDFDGPPIHPNCRCTTALVPA